MRKNILFVLFFINIFLLKSQVGIFTENPQGVFHIDGLKNNPTNVVPTATQTKDDVVIQQSQGGINMSIGTISRLNSSAQLELGSNTSAFLPNRVALTSLNDMTTVPNPIEGMIVYNTTTNDANSLTPAIYFFRNGQWNQLYSRQVVSTIETRDLFGATATRQANVTIARYSGANSTPVGSADLYFTNPQNINATASNLTKISETAAYAFSLQIYGSVPSATTDRRLVLYVWLTKSPKNLANVLDVAELDFFLPARMTNFSASITLASSLNANDDVIISVSGPNNTALPANSAIISDPRTVSNSIPNPDRTSLTFWKL